MSETTAKIRGKGLEHTGVTEEHAAHMYNNIGGHYVGVVDLKVARHSVDDQGNRSVELVIDTIEVAPNDDTAEHIRRLTRAFHYERGLAVNGGDQLPIPGSDEPTVEQVRAAGRAHELDPEADEKDLADLEAEETDHDQADTVDEHDEAPTPWDYEAPEGASTVVASPFATHDPEPTPAA
jgi:cytoskeletal protein RodZ